MKTEDLIDLLSTNLEPVDSRIVVRNLRTAIAAGLVLALASCVAALGLRPGLTVPAVAGYVLIKIGFAAAVAALSAHFLLRHARPGGENSRWIGLTVVPFVALMVLAALTLMSAPVSSWGHLMMGERWLGCLLSIPVIAVAPFAVIIWAIHMAAPTNLARTGALAGLVAGGLSASAYALHCPDDSLPFVALWYGGAIVLCTLAGAALGRRLLRW